VLALRIRQEIAEGQYDRALGDLQTGFGLARHIGNGTTLIHSLVGVSMCGVMIRELEQWGPGQNPPTSTGR